MPETGFLVGTIDGNVDGAGVVGTGWKPLDTGATYFDTSVRHQADNSVASLLILITLATDLICCSHLFES